MKKSITIRTRLIAVVVGATVGLGITGATADAAGASGSDDVVVVSEDSSFDDGSLDLSSSDDGSADVDSADVGDDSIIVIEDVSSSKFGGFFSALRGIIRW